MSEHPTDLLPGYVLGALNPDEAFFVAEHLRTCRVCRAEAEEFRATVSLLPYATASVQPPDRIKRQLFARIAAAQELQPAPVTSSAVASPPPAAASAPRRPMRRWTGALAAVAAACALVFGFVALESRQQVAALNTALGQSQQQLTSANASLSSSQQQLSDASATLESRQQELNALNATLSANQQQLATLQAEHDAATAFIAAPQTVSRALAPQISGLAGRMYMQPGHNRVVLVITGLPPPPAGRTYQFWFANSKGQVPSEVFTTADGVTELVIDAPGAADSYTAVMVTVEPGNGSSVPSDEVVLAGEVQS